MIQLENMEKNNKTYSIKAILVLIGWIFLLSTASWGQKILITKAKVHVGDGTVIEQGLVGIENGEITLVKNALTYPVEAAEWDTIIELSNQHLYPGFFAMNSTLGLTEIDAVRATVDFKEVGEYNPHIRSLIAFNVESRIISTVRSNGVLFAQATPRGGVISGTSSLMHLDGYNWEDAVVKKDEGIHVNWPKTMQGGGWWAEPKPKTPNKKYIEEKHALVSFLHAAAAYQEQGSKAVFDPRYEAMKGVFEGRQRIYFHANELRQLLDVVSLVQEFKFKFPVIVGGYDSYKITELLRDGEIPVMLTRLHRLPDSEDDPMDLVYRLPKLLQDGGVKFCLENAGDMEAMQSRNIPFLAGTARAYGLTEEQAVQSVTLNAAEIIGVEKKYGSIEVGKKATLFVSKGDALDMRTHDVTLILVDGKFAAIKHHQHELYEKYRNKK